MKKIFTLKILFVGFIAVWLAILMAPMPHANPLTFHFVLELDETDSFELDEDELGEITKWSWTPDEIYAFISLHQQCSYDDFAAVPAHCRAPPTLYA